MNKIYKYRDFNCYTNNIITNSSLYFSHSNDFNDPYDCHLSFKEEYDDEDRKQYIINRQAKDQIEPNTIEYLESLKNDEFNAVLIEGYNKQIDELGILSLSTNAESILMWSHYAHNHTGLVFEFDKSLDMDFFKELSKVRYEDKYSLFSCINIDDVVESMLFKSKSWEYEEEGRIIDLDFQGEKAFKKKSLIGIIFGAKARESDIKKFINLCERNGFEHINFKKAIIQKGSFELIIKDFNHTL